MASLIGKSEHMHTAESAIDTDGKEQFVQIAQSIELDVGGRQLKRRWPTQGCAHAFAPLDAESPFFGAIQLYSMGIT
jgi:hypothetical protein